MPTPLKSLQEFFNKRVFRIPDYQRGFAWGPTQVQDFWQDLHRIPQGRNHYTGLLTLEAVAQESWQKWDEDLWLITGSSYKPFYIVDGQQRLTTAVILLKCLLDSIADDVALAFTPKTELIGNYLFRQAGISRAYLFGYEKDNPSYEFLKTEILGQPSNAAQGIETVYTANLRRARDFFRENLRSISVEQKDELFRRLTQRFVFNEYELDGDLDVFVVFETMNNRGKPLSKLELLKNRLIYLSTLLPVKSDEQKALRRNINDAWKTIYEYLGKESTHPLDDDEFLRAHWIISFVYARDEAEQYASFLLDQYFTADRVTSGKLTAAEIQAYVDSIQSASKSWYAIHFPHREPALSDRVRAGLERLQRLGIGAFAPLTLAALLAPVSFENELAFLTAAERFVFLVARICHRRSNTGDSEFFRLAGQVHRGQTTLQDATALVQTRTSQHFSLEKAQLEMRELFDDGEGFYSWSGLKYFLFEYEQHLKDEARMQAAKINWDEFTTSKKDHVTVEHIFPASPKVSEWPTFETYSPKDQHSLRQSLGNLLALSQSRNSSLSNRPFSRKKQDNDGVRGYFNGSYSEIAVAQEDDWTPRQILDRGLRMLEFLRSRWSVRLGSRDNMIWLLRLECLEQKAHGWSVLDELEEIEQRIATTKLVKP
jgi:uncharacterized protein with ParB-like and HNH nuclease domain